MSQLYPKWNKNRELILKNKYLLNDEDSWDDIVSRLEKASDLNSHGILDDFNFVPAGRILRNLGSKHEDKTFFNCYVQAFEDVGDGIDSRSAIMDLFTRVFEISARGGGVGINFTSLRPKGTKVEGVDGVSSGAISWMEAFDGLVDQITQGGSRRGAYMIGMEPWHPDIFNFITVKSDLNKINNANLSVFASNDFMEAVKNDEDWYLEFPDTSYKYYDEEWDGNLKKWKEKDYPIIHYDTVKAKRIFDYIIEYAHANGEPGLVFLERYNELNIPNQDERIISTNPCVTKDTKILTDSGYKRIDMCLEKPVKVWNGEEFSEVQPKITSRNEKILKFKLSTGQEIRTTYYHGFILNDGTEVEAQDLKVGDKLCKWERPVIEGHIDKPEIWAYSQGFYSGDGTKVEDSINEKPIFLYNGKIKLAKYLDYTSKGNILEANGDSRRIEVRLDVDGGYKDKDFVPSAEYTKEVRLIWLAGIIDSDGSINDKGGSVSISSINRDFLLNIKYMIDTLGLNGSLIVEKEGGTKMMPDGSGSKKEYNVNTSYHLILSAYTVMKLREMGLNTHRVDVSIANPNRSAARFPQITSIKKQDSIEDKVYCFNEPKLHTGVFNGLRASQCGEQGLSKTGVCNLGAINLVKMIDEERELDYEKLKETVEYGIEFLDKMIDLNPYYLDSIKESQQSFRRIGLGIMGWADYLILRGIEYGPEESLQEARNVWYDIQNIAFRKSAQLAKEKGAAPVWDEYMLDNKYIKQLDPENQKYIEKHGLRNTRILTIAPTGSTAMLAGVSSGLEPNFAYEYTRNDVLGKRTIKHWMLEQNIDVDEDNLVTTHDVAVDQHVKMQATMQKYIDSSTSKTINAPEDATQEDTAEAFMLAYDTGCKGVTYYRDKSRSGVLTKDEDEQMKVSELEQMFDEYGDSVIPHNVKIPKEPPVDLYKRKDNHSKKWYFFIAFADRNKTRPFALFIKTNNYEHGDVADWIISKIERLAYSKGVEESIIDEQAKKYSGQSNVDKIARAIGLALRHNIKIIDIVKVLDACDPEFSSLLFHIKKLLSKFISDGTKTGDSCPDCGESLVYNDSCEFCPSCGYSAC